MNIIGYVPIDYFYLMFMSDLLTSHFNICLNQMPFRDLDYSIHWIEQIVFNEVLRLYSEVNSTKRSFIFQTNN